MVKGKRPKGQAGFDVSRRGFLKGAGAVLSSGIVVGAESFNASVTSSRNKYFGTRQGTHFT